LNKRKICLISCVKSKRDGCHKAKDLYTGTLYTLHMDYAKKVLKLKDDDIFILSAEHGLLPLNKEICKYEKTLNNMPISLRQRWAKNTLQQFKDSFANLNEIEFIFLAGEKYYEYLIDLLPNTIIPNELYKLPLGKRMQKLKEVIKESE